MCEVTIVNDDFSREECRRVRNGYADYGDGQISAAEWSDVDKFPRKQWLEFVPGDESFLVTDNRTGDCFVECFQTLDGALLYLSDVKTTCEHVEDWDYYGAVKDRGGFMAEDNEGTECVPM